MEYRSDRTLFGLPLVHVKTSSYSEGRRQIGIAKGWIAVGDIAVSPFLAIGGIALGLIANGGMCLGLLLALGGLSVGGVALGGAAIGLWAGGGLAIALFVAMGGTAIAAECAFGGLAVAEYTNMSDPLPCIAGTFKWAAQWLTGNAIRILAVAALAALTINSRKSRQVK